MPARGRPKQQQVAAATAATAGHSHSHGHSNRAGVDDGLEIVVESEEHELQLNTGRRDVIQILDGFEVSESGKIFCADGYSTAPRVIVEGSKPGMWKIKIRKFREVVCWVVAYHEEMGEIPNALCVKGIIEEKQSAEPERIWVKEGYAETDVGFVGIFDGEKYQVDKLVPEVVDYEPVLSNMPFFSHVVAKVGQTTVFGFCCASGEGDFPCHVMRSSTGEAVAIRITIAEERDVLRADRLVARAELAWPSAMNDGSTRVRFVPDPDMPAHILDRIAGQIRFLNDGLPSRSVYFLFKFRRALAFSFFFSVFLILVAIFLHANHVVGVNVQDWLLYFAMVGSVIPSILIGFNIWGEIRLWERSRSESFRRVDEMNEGRSSTIPLLPMSAAAAADNENVVWELKWSNQYVSVGLFRAG